MSFSEVHFGCWSEYIPQILQMREPHYPEGWGKVGADEYEWGVAAAGLCHAGGC